MSSASSSKGKVEIKFEHRNIPLCNTLRAQLVKDSKKMEALCKEFKALKAKLQHVIADVSGDKEKDLQEKMETVSKGVELWDLLEQEVLKHCNLLGDAYKLDEKTCAELLSEGEIIKVKLDSMTKGAKTEKTAALALLPAIGGPV